MADKPLTKTQLLTQIADKTDLSKKQVQAVLDEMSGLIESSLSSSGPGAFTIPGLCKIAIRVKPARPAQQNVWMPMLQAYKDLAAKPEQRVVKVTPLKKLKDMA